MHRIDPLPLHVYYREVENGKNKEQKVQKKEMNGHVEGEEAGEKETWKTLHKGERVAVGDAGMKSRFFLK